MPFADISKCSIDLQVIRSAEGLIDHVSNALSPHKFVSELRPEKLLRERFLFPFLTVRLMHLITFSFPS